MMVLFQDNEDLACSVWQTAPKFSTIRLNRLANKSLTEQQGEIAIEIQVVSSRSFSHLSVNERARHIFRGGKKGVGKKRLRASI